VALEPPSLETRCLILAAAGRREEVNLPEEVTCYLAGKVESNVGELLAALRRVIAASQSKGGGVDLALAQQALGDDHSMVPIGEVLKAVSARFAVPQDRLASAKPARKSAVARDAAIYLSRRLTPMGVAEIASAFGGLTAAQVVEINRRVERERTADPAFAAVLDEIAQEAKNAS
jgi:chromosomal replication initiator protein